MVELFLKNSQFLFHVRVISEILPILEIHGKVDGGFNFNTMVNIQEDTFSIENPLFAADRKGLRSEPANS